MVQKQNETHYVAEDDTNKIVKLRVANSIRNRREWGEYVEELKKEFKIYEKD